MHTTTIPTLIPKPRTPNTSTAPPARFVDPEDLTCPGCGERPIRCEPPALWRVSDGLPVPQFSHRDATPLCRTRGGAVAEPIELV